MESLNFEERIQEKLLILWNNIRSVAVGYMVWDPLVSPHWETRERGNGSRAGTGMVPGLSLFPGQAGSTELMQEAGCLSRWGSTGGRSPEQPDSNDAEC